MFAAFDVEHVRQQFPALARTVDGQPAAYFDGPGGSQVPIQVAQAVSDCLIGTNANHGGPFATSRESDQILADAHQAVADFLGTDDADEVVFGANMTTLTLSLSRAIGRTWTAGDEIIVSRLDHDANVSPWVLAARDAGAIVQYIDLNPDDCTLNLDDFQSKLSDRTKLVAIGYASNATGTINPVQDIVQAAHEFGAQVFVDAVHYAPHGLIDVAELDCDFLACSAYKFFGPHVGILWGKRQWLETLEAYKLRPAVDNLPDKWMTGTQSHEGIAGTLAAIDYLADLGRGISPNSRTRRPALTAAYAAIGDYERELAARLLTGLSEIPDIRVWGITGLDRLNERVPTVSITHTRLSPQSIAEKLAEAGIFVWPGNHYALQFTEAMGLEPGGTLRAGLLHYNTVEEIDRLLNCLRQLH